MRYLGIDWGEKRWGLSYGDEIGIATPLEAIVNPELEEKWVCLTQLVEQRRIESFVVGYPLNMDGSVGFKAKEVDQFITQLELQCPSLPIHRVDERLTSHTAGLSWTAKQKRQKRKSGKLDSSSAAIILQDYLDQLNLCGDGALDMDEEEYGSLG